jgi:transcription initiation factor TFIID TATA-box-binding protein
LKIEIVSTMGSGSLERELDLRPLVDELVENSVAPVRTNFTNESMVTIYFGERSPAFTFYRTGSLDIRGAKNEKILFEAESKIKTLLSEIGVKFPNYNFRHVTSVFLGDLDVDVNLEPLAIALSLEHAEYEPEQFPAIVYKPRQFDVTLLIFSTGKIIVGGTTSRETVSSSLQHVENEIYKLVDN